MIGGKAILGALLAAMLMSGQAVAGEMMAASSFFPPVALKPNIFTTGKIIESKVSVAKQVTQTLAWPIAIIAASLGNRYNEKLEREHVSAKRFCYSSIHYPGGNIEPGSCK